MPDVREELGAAWRLPRAHAAAEFGEAVTVVNGGPVHPCCRRGVEGFSLALKSLPGDLDTVYVQAGCAYCGHRAEPFAIPRATAELLMTGKPIPYADDVAVLVAASWARSFLTEDDQP